MAFPFPPLSPSLPPSLPLSLSLSRARYQGLQVIVEKIMTACLLVRSLMGLRITNSLGAAREPHGGVGRVASYQLIVFTGPASGAALITNSYSSGSVAPRPLSDFYALSAIFTFYTFRFYSWFFFSHCLFTVLMVMKLHKKRWFDVHLNPGFIVQVCVVAAFLFYWPALPYHKTENHLSAYQ